MSILGKPDFERMLEKGDWPMLVHYANYKKDLALSREATKVAARDPRRLVEYVYDTAVWAKLNAAGHGRKLPRRAIRQIDEAAALLRRLGSRAAGPLASSVRVYDEYGDPDENVRVLFFAIVFDTLERIGADAADELRDLAAMADEDVGAPAREILQRLADRGVIESTDAPRRGSSQEA
jgi:hypothetical protein